MNILIVEDDPQELEEVLPVCSQEDSVQTAGTCQNAISALDNAWPEVIISDAIFPAQPSEYPDRYKTFMIGILLDKLHDSASKRRRKLPRVILISGAAEAAEHFSEIADWLVDGRLYDVVPKGGFGSWAFFRAVLAHRLNSLRRDVRFAGVLQNAAEAFREMARCGIITQDPSMLQVWEVVKRHALEDNHSENLFLSGEMGVGKDLVAQAVARLKDPEFRLKDPCYPLRESEFLPFNCNVTEGLFLSEMFGTKPGAFNDAKDNPGLIERAGNGVLFLDQFCSISETNQRQLLRVLEENTRQYRRLGGAENKRAKCKFVIADTVSPKAALRAGVTDQKRLIQEMYSRLALGSVTVPPLRDRRDDIPLLTRFFLDEFNPSHNKVTLEEDVVERFSQGPWNGNVRALHDIVRKIVQTSAGCVGWAQVCSCFDPDVLSPEVGDEPLKIKRGGREDEGILKEEIRAHLNEKGRGLFEALERRLQDSSRKLDLDPYNVYKLLHYLCSDQSRKIRVSDSLNVLGIADSQFTKVVRVLYESTTDSYKKYHLITMLKEEKDGKALTYLLMGDLYC